MAAFQQRPRSGQFEAKCEALDRSSRLIFLGLFTHGEPYACRQADISMGKRSRVLFATMMRPAAIQQAPMPELCLQLKSQAIRAQRSQQFQNAMRMQAASKNPEQARSLNKSRPSWIPLLNASGASLHTWPAATRLALAELLNPFQTAHSPSLVVYSTTMQEVAGSLRTSGDPAMERKPHPALSFLDPSSKTRRR